MPAAFQALIFLPLTLLAQFLPVVKAASPQAFCNTGELPTIKNCNTAISKLSSHGYEFGGSIAQHGISVSDCKVYAESVANCDINPCKISQKTMKDLAGAIVSNCEGVGSAYTDDRSIRVTVEKCEICMEGTCTVCGDVVQPFKRGKEGLDLVNQVAFSGNDSHSNHDHDRTDSQSRARQRRDALVKQYLTKLKRDEIVPPNCPNSCPEHGLCCCPATVFAAEVDGCRSALSKIAGKRFHLPHSVYGGEDTSECMLAIQAKKPNMVVNGDDLTKTVSHALDVCERSSHGEEYVGVVQIDSVKDVSITVGSACIMSGGTCPPGPEPPVDMT